MSYAGIGTVEVNASKVCSTVTYSKFRRYISEGGSRKWLMS